VKNADREEAPLANIERDPLLMGGLVILSAGLVYLAWIFLKDVNPLGIVLMIPGSILSFQTLWLLLNPFALVYSNRILIRQSWFHDKTRYFGDIRKTSFSGKGKFFITYKDDEVELIGLFGIRPSHKSRLADAFNAQIKTQTAAESGESSLKDT
jgi:hypothetical protein